MNRMPTALLCTIVFCAISAAISAGSPVVVELTDGSRMKGTVADSGIQLHTDHGKMNVPVADIRQLVLDDDHETAWIELHDGQKLHGTLHLPELSLATLAGEVMIPSSVLSRLAARAFNLQDRLWLHFACDQPGPEGELLDRGRFEQHGTAMGVNWSKTGRHGGALRFGGTTEEYAMLKPVKGLPSLAITIAFWLRTEKACGGLFSYAATSKDSNHLLIADSGALVIDMCSKHVVTALAVNDGKWHHLAVTWESDSGRLSLYKDARLVFVTTVAAGRALSDAGSLVLGQDQDSYGGRFTAAESFDGLLDEIMVFDTALSLEEVEYLYYGAE